MYSIRLLLISTLLVGSLAALKAQVYSEQKTQSRSFRVRTGMQIQIFNKYGNITIMPWQKDSVRFEATISARSKQAAKVLKILSSIDCEMMATASTVSARTVFYDNNATFWKDVVSYAGQVINTSNDLQINYLVYMPTEYDLKVENKFGNVYMDNHQGNANLTVLNGDLQARSFSGELKLKIEFGSASLQDVGNAEISANYSDLTIHKVSKLDISSRSSNIDLNETNSLELDSQRDKITLNSCSQISGNAMFSRIKVSDFGSQINMSAKYGELKLNNVERGFKYIELRTEYTDIYLGLSQNASYSLDLYYDNKTSLILSPVLNNQMKKTTVNQQTGAMQASATIGKASAAQVSVTSKAGSISVVNK